MKFWKQKPKVHLSPRLARAIGRSGKSSWFYVSQAGLVILVGFALFTLLSGSDNKQIFQNRGNTYESFGQGEVLGAQTSSVIEYQVQPGDSLISISERFNVYWMAIVEENELKAPYQLTPGQILTIPLPRDK